MPAGRLPLERFLVLDLTIARAGPTCVRQLADWGARVIRIEQVGGARSDVTGAHRDGSDAQNLHRNKRAMTIDLKSPEGKAVFFEMAKKADVIVENMRAPVKFRLGIDYESVKKVNPRVVYGSLSGFGQDGPYEARAGVDQIAQGMSGVMSITGLPGQGPVRVGLPIADLTSGIFLSEAILVALLDREATGKGQWVQTSLIESTLFMLDFQATRWLTDHEIPGQAGNDHPTTPATGVYQTSDGAVNLSGASESQWSRLCRVLGLQEIEHDPRFNTTPLRRKNNPELKIVIGSVLCTRPSEYWVKAFEAEGVPCGPIYNIAQAFEDPQVKHLGIARYAMHRKKGRIGLLGQPFRLSEYPQPEELKPAPGYDEHTVEILKEFGYSDEKIAELREKKAV